ncbi:MAG TPA: hypothetical protein VLM79_36325 [Kofleriaceae bacterium]|nr:hypothetical protein [Kofleriaceae bacterium]
MPSRNLFSSIASKDLAHVSGGASRVTSRASSSNDQLTTMMTQITSSIKDLASNKNQGMDPMMMMMMMMMGGGGGGGAAAPPPPPPPPAPAAPVISISTNIRH